jgi:hypothetical protein
MHPPHQRRRAVTTTKTHVLHVQSVRGDDRHEWTPGNAIEEAEARAAFARAVNAGFLAYTMDEKTGGGQQIKDFDPNAERIVATVPLVGG